MLDLPGYHKLKSLHRTEDAAIFSALNKENKKVIIKFLTKASPSHADIARFMNEYNLVKNLHGAGTIEVYDFIMHENQFAIVEEDFGISLAKWLNRNELSIKDFLIMAISITEALEKIHEQNIVHKDINPNNILYDAPSGVIKIIDFGIAS